MKNETKSREELDKIIKQEAVVMVYFYSNKCAPCISLRPKVEGMIDNNFKEMKLVFVDSEANPELPANYNVFSNPTLIIFIEGKEYRRESKYISIPQLMETISRPYNLLFD